MASKSISEDFENLTKPALLMIGPLRNYTANLRGQHERIYVPSCSLSGGGMRAFLILVLLCVPAIAHDHSNPAQNEWYQSLMQPDNPTMSCCGEADAYWADEVHVRNGKTYVMITDDRDDVLLKRPHIPNGTEIEVPNNKLKWDRGNPTGHGVIFLSPHPYNFVYCYVQPGGA